MDATPVGIDGVATTLLLTTIGRKSGDEDVELGGGQVPRGSRIFVMWAAGSLDEREFPDPMTFDIDRKNKSAHSTFGLGKHHCAGNSLARAELSQAVESGRGLLWADARRYPILEFSRGSSSRSM